MEAKPILQIVSGFKPDVDGMGDFARLLGNTLWQQSKLRSHFLIYRRPRTPFDANEILPNSISYSAEASPSACLKEIASLCSQRSFDCALLHYGPYAYSRKGETAAFVQAIEELAKDMRVLVFFHEIYASGMPWKRAFWTNRQQRKSVGNLLRFATAGFTSNAKYMQQLQELNTADRSVTKIPIFSNIGEPSGLRPLDQRSRQLVIFGQLVTRVRLYRDHRHDLERVCKQLDVETIVDVGSGQSPHIPTTLAGATVRSAGWMDERQLSNLMADSIAGIVGYWPDVWEKSGVIAAYQAHALVPILVESSPRRIPAPPYLPYVLAEDIAGLLDKDGTVSNTSLQQIADASHSYYMRNQSVHRCAEVIARSVVQTISM
jgi:hypothetical protein